MPTENLNTPFLRNQRNFTGYDTLADADAALEFKNPGLIVYEISTDSFFYWDGSAWQTFGTGGGGSSTYAGADPTTTTVGGLVAGSAILGLSYDAILQAILVPYIAPTFSSFTISGQATTLEVGQPMPANSNFAWGTTNSANVSPNSITITDITNAIDLGTGLANDGAETLANFLVTPIIPTTNQWRASLTDIHATTINSSTFSVSWLYRVYSGTSASASLNAAGIAALATSSLSSTKNGTRSFAAGDYKYICYPNSFGNPTAGTGFKDADTNLTMAMATSADDAFFSNVGNGWSYGLVTVTNAFSVPISYRVYRTKNTLSGTINITVS